MQQVRIAAEDERGTRNGCAVPLPPCTPPSRTATGTRPRKLHAGCKRRQGGAAGLKASCCLQLEGKKRRLGYYSHCWIPRPIFVGLNHIFLF